MSDTRSQLLTEVLVRLGKDTTTSFYTESMINNWLDRANKWGAGFKKWPFTEYMDKSGAHTQGTEQYTYFNTGFKTDSIRLLKIGSESKLTENLNFEKKNFDDYMRFREKYPDRTDEIFSDFGRIVYINPNCASGSIYAFGQLIPAKLEDSHNTVFGTAAEEDGDEAIIAKVLSFAFTKEQRSKESSLQSEASKTILLEIWDKITAEQYAYQTKDRSMFKHFPIVRNDRHRRGDDVSNPFQF